MDWLSQAQGRECRPVERSKGAQQLHPASQQTQAHGYKNIHIKGGGGMLGTIPRVQGS